MRKIPALPIIIFSVLITITLLLSYFATIYSDSIILGIVVFLAISILIHRILGLMYPPREEGYTEKDNLLAYDISSVYDVLIFEMILHTPLLPYPLERMLDNLMGMKLGDNTYPGGATLSGPYHFISVGDNVIFGGNSIVSPHSYESGGKVTLKPIRIGNNATIGMSSVIMCGVVVEDDAIVAAGAVVTKDTHIGRGEVWAGVPAKKIRDAQV